MVPEGARDIGFDQNLGGQVPLDVTFRDETGKSVRFGDLLRGRPVVLSVVYYECPMLCTLVLNGVVSAFKPVTLVPGTDYDVISVLSIPPKPPNSRRARRPRTSSAWASREPSRPGRSSPATKPRSPCSPRAVGFRYAWDEGTKQFAHPSGIVLLSPDGKISRYLFGVEYAPKDVRLGLVEASAGKIGGFSDQILLYCYMYDPTRGRYSAAVLNLVRAGALLTIVSLVTFIGVSRRRERRQQPADPSHPPRSEAKRNELAALP